MDNYARKKHQQSVAKKRKEKKGKEKKRKEKKRKEKKRKEKKKKMKTKPVRHFQVYIHNPVKLFLGVEVNNGF